MDKIKLESDIDDLKLLNAMVSDAWRKQLPIGSGLIERLLSAMDVTYKNYKDAIPNLKTVEEIFGEMKKDLLLLEKMLSIILLNGENIQFITMLLIYSIIIKIN